MARNFAEAFPPGEFLAEELEERDWTQTDFAQVLGRPVQFVSEIVSGKKEITRESAAQIAAALGTSTEYWLNLQNSYLLWKQSQDQALETELNEVRARASLASQFPIAFLKKRGMLQGNTAGEQKAELLQVLAVSDLEQRPTFLAAARRTNVAETLSPTQLAWLAFAARKARALGADTYKPELLADLASQMSRRLQKPAALAQAQDWSAAVGVRLVYLEAFPNSKLSGAAFALDDDEGKPVIALSGRGRRIDVVLFTLLHEAAHLVRGDLDGQAILDEGDGHTLGDEAATNALAADWAIPGGLSRPPGPIRQAWIEQEAERVGVHPIIVVGRLQREGILDWRSRLSKGAPSAIAYLESWR